MTWKILLYPNKGIYFALKEDDDYFKRNVNILSQFNIDQLKEEVIVIMEVEYSKYLTSIRVLELVKEKYPEEFV